MNQQPIPERSTMLNNLRQEMVKSSTTCDDYKEALIELAELDAYDRPGDTDPRFAAFTKHMSGCVDCAREFESLARTIRVNRDRVAPAAPAKTRKFPLFFAEPSRIRQQDNFILKLWEGAKRKLDLEVRSLMLAQKVPVMSAEPLFSSEVSELSGRPFFAVNALRTNDTVTIRVAIMDVRRGAWEVSITAGDFAQSQVTNQTGIAEFAHVPIAALANGLRVVCEERTP